MSLYPFSKACNKASLYAAGLYWPSEVQLLALAGMSLNDSDAKLLLARASGAGLIVPFLKCTEKRIIPLAIVIFSSIGLISIY